MRLAIWLSLGALVGAPAVNAESLAFDFDTDGDPTTVNNEIVAVPGEIVEAYLVINDVPSGHAFVHGLQFGLEFTAGLEFVAMSVVGLDGAMGNDETDGIVVIPEDPMPAAEFPSFAMRFALRVLGDGPQSVSIMPSRGWGYQFDGFVYLVSESGQGDVIEVEDSHVIDTQREGRINAATPTLVVSWGHLKGHF